MESPTPMTNEELLEQAALDALGLLDQYESLLFTRSFHRATATLQKQIVEFQADLASDESLLPDDLPPADLRDRVLAAVADAVESQEADFAPLASIGVGRVERQYESAMPARRQLRVTAVFWRAAVLILTVALVIVSYFGVDAYSTAKRLAVLGVSQDLHDDFERALGTSGLEFISHPANRTVHFTAPNGEFEGSVTLYINNKTSEAFVVALGMPDDDEPYTLVASSGTTVHRRDRFDITGPIVGVRMSDLSSSTMASTSWSIRNSKGAIVLQSS